MSNETEQQPTEQQETTAAAPQGFDREALIAAVREAGGTQSVDVGAEEAAAAAPTEATTTETPPAEEDRVAKILRLREENHRKAEEQRAAARNVEEEARRRGEKIIEDARAEAKRLAENEAAARAERFKKSPIEVLRELGDPQQVVDQALTANTPEARARAKLEADLAAAKEDAKAGKGAAEEIRKLREELQQQQEAQRQAAVKAQFLSTHASEEKAPYLHARYEPDEIVSRSLAQAQAWVNDGLRYKIDFDDGDVAAYLEKQSRERFERLKTNPAAASSTAPGTAAPSKAAVAPAGAGSAAKVSANGPRTLSAAQGSERRTSPKPLHEMTPEQQRAALIEEVAAARRNNPDAAF